MILEVAFVANVTSKKVFIVVCFYLEYDFKSSTHRESMPMFFLTFFFCMHHGKKNWVRHTDLHEETFIIHVQVIVFCISAIAKYHRILREV